MTAMAVPSRSGMATPWLSSLNKGFLGRAPEDDIELTPLATAPVVPALREAVLRFEETFNPIHDHETVRVVIGGYAPCRTWISSASISGPLQVVFIGETPAVGDTALPVDPETADPLAVFDRLQIELGVTQKDLLAATGIKRRTYYSWKKPSTPRPRPTSLGALWHLADALVDLREEIGRPVAAWLHALPEREVALREGRFDDLVDLAVAMPRPSRRAMGTSLRLGVSPDIDVPITRPGRPKVTVIERGGRR
ncbi:hypothetical protein NFC73_19325 [Pseudarthrobacter sp. RMG13]|uniref:XRE family transcriptional regulator n=1 Tax=Pseudarthrobacter humi TaxID=2952523 RepID=A0ABT1LTR8_9MICC|nr:hypothetical protein [Pseudarthrobacter humi]MCP9001863.1 hypothetical protein [Pseudarthrobacter humi]